MKSLGSGFLGLLEDTARYAGLLLALAEGFGLRPRLFLPLGPKKELFMLFWPIFGDFRCPVVTVVTFSSNLSNLKKKPKKKTKKSKKNPKNSKNPKIPKNQKNTKNLKKIKKIPPKIRKNPKSP